MPEPLGYTGAVQVVVPPGLGSLLAKMEEPG